VRTLRPAAVLLGATRLAERPIRLADLERAELQVLRGQTQPTEYGKAGEAPHTAIKGADPSAKLILAAFAKPRRTVAASSESRAQLVRQLLSIRCTSQPGIAASNGVALHPYTPDLPAGAEIEEFRKTSQRRRRQGPLDNRARLELRAPESVGQRPSQGRSPGQAPNSKAPSRCCSAIRSKWRLQRVYWFSVDDRRGSCNFCGGTGLFGEGFVPKKSWFAYVKFAGGNPG
jgi:hypothetical protein